MEHQRAAAVMAQCAPCWGCKEVCVQEMWSRLHVEQRSQETYKFGR
jgi:hypothetical protein